MDLASVADDLYGAPLAEFVTARARHEKQARAAGDGSLARAVHGLRKPTQAAWAVNQLVRRSPELLDELLQLGDSLRTAQDARDTAEIRRLTVRRREVYAVLRRRAEELVAEDGRQLGAAAEQALERTTGAALADPSAARAVRSGRLVGDLENAGWGTVDLDGALAVPLEHDAAANEATASTAAASTAAANTTTASATAARDAAAREEAERARAVADDEAAAAAAALEAAESTLVEAVARRQHLADRTAALTEELRRLAAEEERAAHDVRSAREARAAAARSAHQAGRAAERARRHLDGLARRP